MLSITGGWFVVSRVTVVFLLSLSEPPRPSLTVTLMVTGVSLVTVGAW